MDSTLEVEGRTFAVAPIVDIARGAGELIMKVYNDDSESWDVAAKSDASPVTKADLQADRHIGAALRAAYPGVPIMSEEIRNEPYAVRAAWPLYWCVDPLDGTKEFLRRNGEFTVNIALVHRGRPVLGVVYAPARDEMYYAVKGAGAYGKDGRMRAAEFSENDQGLTLVCSRSHRDERTEKFLNKFSKPNTKAIGSSLKFMLVASGEAHIYPRLAPTMEWDTAASQIIVEEAGGVVLRESDGNPMVYNKEDLLNPYFIVYGARQS